MKRSKVAGGVEAVGRIPSFAVIGAGHGGLAMAAALSVKGFTVSLYNRSPERLAEVKRLGGVQLSGPISGFGRLDIVTTDIGRAIAGVDVIMVVLPAVGHRAVAEACAPYLADGQMIVLNPGRTGGALEFNAVLQEKRVTARVIVAEAQTFIFASRTVAPAHARIFGLKYDVPVAALPASETPVVVETLRKAFTQFSPAESVLKTSFDNIGAIFHPAPTLLNSGRIEATSGDFEYYHEGITPSVASIIERMDQERTAVAAALGVEAISAWDWLGVAYGAYGSSLYEAVQNNKGYSGIKAPSTLQHRYIFEDVPASLVPMASIGDMLGIETRTMKSIINLACIAHGIDYWHIGRTVTRLGLAGMSADEIRDFVAGTPAVANVS
ncbi:MAG: NAD/NADP octopine/nopaline dehydrogenase family protein [bacterium]|jgi:opine dehydrogenase